MVGIGTKNTLTKMRIIKEAFAEMEKAGETHKRALSCGQQVEKHRDRQGIAGRIPRFVMSRRGQSPQPWGIDMNISKQEQSDVAFPDFLLSLCEEWAKTVAGDMANGQ